MTLYPTEQWLAEYERRLDESDALDTGWAGGFTGTVLIVITDVPTAETTVDDLPEAALAGVPEPLRREMADLSLDELTALVDATSVEGLSSAALANLPRPLRTSLGCLPFGDVKTLLDEQLPRPLPERQRDLLRQLDEHVVDGTIRAFVTVEDGTCVGTGVLADPDDRETAVTFRASIDTWQRIIGGEHPLYPLLDGEVTVAGSRLRLLRHVRTFGALAATARNVEATYLFGRDDS